jgi:hypothetical protein
MMVNMPILTKEQWEQAAKKYDSGMTHKQIAAHFGVSDWTVSNHLRGVVITRSPQQTSTKYKCNHAAFAKVTDESAYWIGMLMSDGCVTGKPGKPVISLGLTDSDSEHIEAFRDFLKSTQPVRHQRQKPNTFRGETTMCEISVRSDQLANDLAIFGVVPRKSKIAKALSGIETNKHFWRGMIDGNGIVSLHNIENRQNPVINLVGASKDIIEQFQDFILSLVPESTARMRSNPTGWIFSVSGTFAITILDHIYNNHGPSLQRKKETAMKILKMAQDDPMWCRMPPGR